MIVLVVTPNVSGAHPSGRSVLLTVAFIGMFRVALQVLVVAVW